MSPNSSLTKVESNYATRPPHALDATETLLMEAAAASPEFTQRIGGPSLMDAINGVYGAVGEYYAGCVFAETRERHIRTPAAAAAIIATVLAEESGDHLLDGDTPADTPAAKTAEPDPSSIDWAALEEWAAERAEPAEPDPIDALQPKEPPTIMLNTSRYRMAPGTRTRYVESNPYDRSSPIVIVEAGLLRVGVFGGSALLDTEASDTADADRFLALFADRVRYVSPGGWVHKDGQQWRAEQEAMEQMIRLTADVVIAVAEHQQQEAKMFLFAATEPERYRDLQPRLSRLTDSPSVVPTKADIRERHKIKAEVSEWIRGKAKTFAFDQLTRGIDLHKIGKRMQNVGRATTILKAARSDHRVLRRLEDFDGTNLLPEAAPRRLLPAAKRVESIVTTPPAEIARRFLQDMGAQYGEGFVWSSQLASLVEVWNEGHPDEPAELGAVRAELRDHGCQAKTKRDGDKTPKAWIGVTFNLGAAE